MHPADDLTIDAFTPEAVRRKPAARQEWAVNQLMLAAKASTNLGLTRHVTFPGSLLWPYLYPPRPLGLVEEGFTELARRWRPILFLEKMGQHPRANILCDSSHLHLQGMDYVGFIEVDGERIRSFHVMDAAFRKSPRTGHWGGYQNWPTRAGRFRSLGDGEIDFAAAIFAALAEADYGG